MQEGLRGDIPAYSSSQLITMNDVYEELVRVLGRGERAALATLIARQGSAPGALGSKLLVRQDGSTLGSVGGGCVEADVWQAAVDALKTGRPETQSFRLSLKEAADSGLICGGAISVLIEPLGPQELPIYRDLLTARADGERGVLATVLPPVPGQGRKRFVSHPERAIDSEADPLLRVAAAALVASGQSGPQVCAMEEEGSTYSVLLEVITRPKRLVIFGAGHLSKEVAPLAKHLGFRVVVIDDRPIFANIESFPDADEVLVAEFNDVLGRLAVDEDTFLLIVTRGHLHDEILLEQAVSSPAGYVGMIGSRTKIRTLYRRLRARGVAEQQLVRVHAPVGVEIGARLPEEIAVSIVAELIRVRNGGPVHG